MDAAAMQDIAATERANEWGPATSAGVMLVGRCEDRPAPDRIYLT